MIIHLVALALAATTTQAPAALGCPARDTTFFAGTAIGDREAWYGTHLRASGETRLCPSVDRDVFRFLWLRSFHPTVMVRIERNSQGYRLVSKVLTGAGGYEPGTIAQSGERALTIDDVRKLKEYVTAAWYWQSPTAPPGGAMGLDGAQWIVEGVDGERYHVVDRWMPPQGDAFRALGLQFLRMARLQFDSTTVY